MKERILAYEKEDGSVELIVRPKTKHLSILLTIQMLIEILIEITGYDIDKILEDLRFTYSRDKKKSIKSK